MVPRAKKPESAAIWLPSSSTCSPSGHGLADGAGHRRSSIAGGASPVAGSRQWIGYCWPSTVRL